MIDIGRICIVEKNGKARLSAKIKLSNETLDAWENNSLRSDSKMKGRYRREFIQKDGSFDLWFEVDKEYEYSFCTERSDAFLVACLYYAIVSGEDIRCQMPVTDKLLYQIKEYVIPSLCIESEGYRKISIFANGAPEIQKMECYVGTGISCGVDSFSTVMLNTKQDIPDQFKLTHLTLFNTGSMNFDGYAKDKPLTQWRRETEIEFSERIALGKEVAEKLGLRFIAVDTNIPEMYQGCFLYSHTYRNCSAVLATQKMWKNYYYASAGEGSINLAGVRKTQGQYDLLNTMALSLEKLHFYSGGMPYKRLQKTEIIADNITVQKYINVCSFHTHNCGKCSKCIRTLSALDLLGKIDLFHDSFQDMTYYMKNKWKIRATIMESKPEDLFLYEMKEYMQEHNITLNRKSRLYHYLLPLRRIWIWFHR